MRPPARLRAGELDGRERPVLCRSRGREDDGTPDPGKAIASQRGILARVYKGQGESAPPPGGRSRSGSRTCGGSGSAIVNHSPLGWAGASEARSTSVLSGHQAHSLACKAPPRGTVDSAVLRGLRSTGLSRRRPSNRPRDRRAWNVVDPTMATQSRLDGCPWAMSRSLSSRATQVRILPGVPNHSFHNFCYTHLEAVLGDLGSPRLLS